MTNFERIKDMSVENMACFVEEINRWRAEVFLRFAIFAKLTKTTGV